VQKSKRPELKSLLNADAFMVGAVGSILSNLGNIMAATLQQTFVKIHSATKIRILFFVLGQPLEEENRQLEKLELPERSKDCMRLSGSTIFGFILAIGITLTQPYLAFGAGQFRQVGELQGF
jgi:hypothetical protein